MTDALERLRTALAERYAIERELGQGGMATVYFARDLKLGRAVALKVLRPELAASLGGERFLREIEIAAKLAHPHIRLRRGRGAPLLHWSTASPGSAATPAPTSICSPSPAGAATSVPVATPSGWPAGPFGWPRRSSPPSRTTCRSEKPVRVSACPRVRPVRLCVRASVPLAPRPTAPWPTGIPISISSSPTAASGPTAPSCAGPAGRPMTAPP